MKRQVLLYGVVGGVLITVLQWTQYRFMVIEHSVEIYGGLTAATFAGLGIWLGLRLKDRKPAVIEERAAVVPALDQKHVTQHEAPRETPAPALGLGLGLTRREFEILELIAEGLSNREIAARLFVSENTVKTHSSRVLDKLGAKRRTQAVQMGKELGLLR